MISVRIGHAMVEMEKSISIHINTYLYLSVRTIYTVLYPSILVSLMYIPIYTFLYQCIHLLSLNTYIS